MPKFKTSEERIRKIVNRFLEWKLPKDFHPDGGIAYKNNWPNFEPRGANLLTLSQADEMVRHILNQEQE